MIFSHRDISVSLIFHTHILILILILTLAPAQRAHSRLAILALLSQGVRRGARAPLPGPRLGRRATDAGAPDAPTVGAR